MSQSAPGRREVAYRLFATEFDDAEFSYSESDEERAPNYVVTPTGARVNRLFAVGVLTEVESVNPEMVRGRVVDPTGAFVTYAGQYQPDELAYLERADPPTFLALSGKARTFEPDDGDRVFTSVRPESVCEVDADTRDRWVVTTAERTLERIGVVASAIESGLAGDRLRVALEDAGVDERVADGVALALEYYGTTPDYLHALRETALEAVEVVAGERDEAGSHTPAPGEGGGDASSLATLELSEPAMPESVEPATSSDADESVEPTAASDADESVAEPADSATSDDGADGEADAGAVGDDTEQVVDEGTTADAAASDGESGTGAAVSSGGDVDTAEDATIEADADAESDPGTFELDEEARTEVEEEYGTEFSTAGEVDVADESVEDVDVADDDEVDVADEDEVDVADEDEDESAQEAEVEGDDEPEAVDERETVADEPVEGSADSDTAAVEEADPETEVAPESDAEADEESSTAETEAGDVDDIDLENAVVETMEELDGGDGADREELVASVAAEYGVAADEVGEAIQDALMSGRCYEPTDGTLKSI